MLQTGCKSSYNFIFYRLINLTFYTCLQATQCRSGEVKHEEGYCAYMGSCGYNTNLENGENRGISCL